MRVNNFGVSGSILTIFFPYDVPRARGYNVGTIFGRPAPKIWEGRKTVKNLARFLTTFDFDREYLRNESTYHKSEKLLIIYNPSHVRPKNLAYTLVHDKSY